MDLMPQSRVRNQNKIENADKTIDSDPQILTAHVKVLQPGAGEVYALELFRKTILKCRPNNDGVDIDIGIAQAVEIIQAQKAMMQNLPEKLANLPHLQTGLAQDLQTLYSGNVIWVRLSREPGQNMFACLVGLVILGNEKNNEKTLRINVHYPRQGIKDISIFDMPNGTVRLAEPIQLECIVNWNGGKFEKNDDQLCPEYMLNIMKNRGGDSGRAKTPWSGIWEVGAVTCRMIDAGFGTAWIFRAKTLLRISSSRFRWGTFRSGCRRCSWCRGACLACMQRVCWSARCRNFTTRVCWGKSVRTTTRLKRRWSLRLGTQAMGISWEQVWSGCVMTAKTHANIMHRRTTLPWQSCNRFKPNSQARMMMHRPKTPQCKCCNRFKPKILARMMMQAGIMQRPETIILQSSARMKAPWKGVELRVEQKDNNETNNQHNLSPIPEEYMSMVHQFNGIMRPISM